MSQYTFDSGHSSTYFPPISALFQGGGVPSAIAVQSLISDIDGHLDANAKELDNCLQSLLSATNRLPGARTFSTPKDALGYMCSSHTLEKDTCYDPEPEEAVAIIKALCDSLEKHPGSEESILQEILSLAADEGLILPLRCSPLSALSQSSSSLNVQLDSVDQLIEGKWGKLVQSLQKHLVAELLNLPSLGINRRCSWILIERRMEVVGGLKSIASEDDAWITYRNVRGQQLEQLFNSLLPDNDSENVNHKEFCNNCDAVADKIIEMIEEDFSVLSSGVFKKIGGVCRILHDLYLEKYSDEMSVLVEEIADDIRDFNKKVVKTSKSDHGIGKSQGSSSKSQGKSGHRGSLSAASSVSHENWADKGNSLDTMFLASSYKAEKEKGTPRLQKQSSMAFPKDCITSLRHIALSLMKLEDALEMLSKMISWDVTGLPNKKTKKKSNLRGVLKPSSSPEAKRHSLNLGSSFSSSDTQLDTSSNATLLSQAQQSDDMPTPKVVIERSRSEDKVRWDWRLIFKKIASGLSTAVETKMDYSINKVLTNETIAWEEKHTLATIPIKCMQFMDNVDHPQLVSKETEAFVQTINELLPLARAGMDGCLIPVRTAFVDSLGIAVKNYHLHCTKLSKDVPQKATLKQMLTIISNAVYIKNYLQHVDTVLFPEESGKKFMSSLLKQYTELVDGLSKHLLQLHNQLISTAILCDADSGNWNEIKEFYEDERCSFSIQMWNFHLRSAQHDMWEILPPKLAQSLFSSILQDSMLLLMQRYAHVKPSFRRVKLFRYDVLAILLCTTDHLLKSSNSASQYLDPGHNQLPHYSIHNQCSNLLASMAIVTSPIEILYRVFKRGFTRRLDSHGLDMVKPGCNSQWLHWIWPDLIQSDAKHYDDLPTASALYLQVRLLLAQPIMNWGLLMQALLMKDYTLSILMLTRTCLLEESRSCHLSNILRSRSSTGSIGEDTSSPQNKLLASQRSFGSTDSNSPGASRSPLDGTLLTFEDQEERTDIQQVADAVVHVAAHVHYFPDALAKCIIPTIERCRLWEMFNVKNPVVSPLLQVPEWMSSIFKILEPFVDRVIEPMLRYLTHVKTSENYIRPVISYVADLPCGCPPKYSLQDHPEKPSMKDVYVRCLELMIQEIESCILVLPASVCSLFNALESNCKEQGIKTSHRCVTLQIVAWAVWLQLGSLSAHKDQLGEVLSSETRAHILTLADSLFHVLVYGKGPNTPRFAAKFYKTHKDWLQQRFQSISAFISNEFHSLPDADVTEAATNVFSDHIFSLMASNIMDSPHGQQHLNILSNMVVNNGQWLVEQMDVKSPLAGPGSEQKKSVFKLDITQPIKASCFNPLSEMNKLGVNAFDQALIMDFTPDWVKLLTSDLGLSKPGFRSLLMNRQEMQDGAVLEEVEKKPVDVLRAVYEH